MSRSINATGKDTATEKLFKYRGEVKRVDRNLDGVYFRIKRNDKYENVCFSDLTPDERDDVMKDRGPEWLKSLCGILANALKSIGDEFDIMGGERDV